MPSSRSSGRAAGVSPVRDEHEREIKELGITELYASKTPEADIIFVHGHGGSPRKTWVYKGNLRKDPLKKAHVRSIVDKLMKRGSREPVFWPADILPQDHHDVRIMTYGYQSNRRKFLSRTTNKLTISQHGNQFLESIARARHNARGRPIIFVAHDRGGLIVKQAIVEAKKQKKQRLPELHDVYESFQGVVFLGTPHRGFEDAIRSLTPAGKSPDVDLKAKLSPVSKIDRSKQSKLNGLYNDFCDIIIEEEVIRVSNFEEVKKKARLLATRKKVVSDYFSTFGVRDWERTDVINADRTNMCRFPNREDDGYDKVRNAIGFHLGIKRSKANDGSCGELSLVDPSNGENMANWRESNASTVIFDCNGLSHDCKESILQWLHRLAPTKTQVALRNANLRKLEDGTGAWFLRLEELDRWLNEPVRNQQSTVNRMLWFTGEPGVGKSILSCILIEHLEQVSVAGKFGFAWFICHNEEQQTGTSLSLGITRKLLQQLLKQEASLPANLFRIYKKYEKYDGEGLEPLEDECLELLKSVAAKFHKVYIVVDGLDELSHGSRVHAIKTIEALLSSGAYCAITSRTGEPDLEHSFSSRATRLKIGASEPDIWRYLENHISDPCPLANVITVNGQRFREGVIADISRNSDGMMLLAQQNLKELSDENTMEGLENATSNLSNNLNDLYRDTWDRIKKNNSQKVFERVQQVVMWIAFAERPLTVPELRHALAIRDDSEEFNPKALWDTPLDESSLGLVVIDEEQTVRLCHKSACTHFKANLDKFPNANEILAKTCLRYLLLNSLSPGENPTFADIDRQAGIYPFHRYAFENWHIHARKQMAPMQELAMRFLQDSAKVTTSYRLYRYTCYGEDASKVGFTGVQLVALLDLGEFFVPLQGLEVDTNFVDFGSDTSPQSVVEEGEEEGHEQVGERRDEGKENELDEGKGEVEVEGQEKEEAGEETEEEENEENLETIVPPQGPEAEAETLENEDTTPSQDVEEPVSEEAEVENEVSQKEVESDENKTDVEELEKEKEELQDMAVENELVGRYTGESTIERDPPTGETGYLDIQKVIRDFLVGEGKISAREDHDGTQTPSDGSFPEQTPPIELSDDEHLPEGSDGGSSEKSETGLDKAFKIPFPHDDTTQTEVQPSDSRTPFPLTAEHKLSNRHMGTVTPAFKLPSILSGRQYGTPSASLNERVGGLPLYLTPVAEREGLMMKQYSSNSLPGRKGGGARTKSTSDIYDLDGVLTLPKRNMYLYPAARDRYDSMFQAGKSG